MGLNLIRWLEYKRVIWKKQHANSGISTCGCLHLFSQILRILPVAKSPRATIAPHSRSAALRGLRAFGAVQVGEW